MIIDTESVLLLSLLNSGAGNKDLTKPPLDTVNLSTVAGALVLSELMTAGAILESEFNPDIYTKEYIRYIDDICARQIYENLPSVFKLKSWIFEIGQQALEFYAPSKRVIIDKNNPVESALIKHFCHYVESDLESFYSVEVLCDMLGAGYFGEEVISSMAGVYGKFNSRDMDESVWGNLFYPQYGCVKNLRDLIEAIL